MKRFAATLTAALLATLSATSASAPAHSGDGVSASTEPRGGSHDFDFEFGEWRVHHRVKRATGTDQWLEFDGTCSSHALMDGSANVENHRFDKPNGVTHGVALRAFDAKAGEWAIWWIDSRTPHGALDPPMKGNFEKGVGTFYSDFTQDGKPMRVRFIWSEITLTSARWQQAYSADDGKTWETNWVMEFHRA